MKAAKLLKSKLSASQNHCSHISEWLTTNLHDSQWLHHASHSPVTLSPEHSCNVATHFTHKLNYLLTEKLSSES